MATVRTVLSLIGVVAVAEFMLAELLSRTPIDCGFWTGMRLFFNVVDRGCFK